MHSATSSFPQHIQIHHKAAVEIRLRQMLMKRVIIIIFFIVIAPRIMVLWQQQCHDHLQLLPLRRIFQACSHCLCCPVPIVVTITSRNVDVCYYDYFYNDKKKAINIHTHMYVIVRYIYVYMYMRDWYVILICQFGECVNCIHCMRLYSSFLCNLPKKKYFFSLMKFV